LDDKLEQQLQDLLVATSDYRDEALPEALHHVLKVVRDHIAMDVVFVSQIAEGQRSFVAVDADPAHDVIRPGMSDPVEQSWCHHIVEGRLPMLIPDGKPLIASGQAPYTPLEIGTHLSVPVVLEDGSVYGTVCAFSFRVHEGAGQADVTRLKAVARLVGQRIDAHRAETGPAQL